MKTFDTPLDEMLYILSKESEQVVPDNLSYADKRWLLNSLMTIRSPGYLDDRFLSLQNEMLSKENLVNCYDCSECKYKKHFAITARDITHLKIDAICCETMDYLGNMTPNLKCIDNKLLLSAGLALREDCNKINKHNNFICKVGSAFLLSGYNLPADNVVKMILPRVEELCSRDVELIKSGIVSALDILRNNGCKNFAFNLSLDKMFNIPSGMYINIAVNTIREYVKTKKYKCNCVLVLDNDADLNVVKDLLKIKQVY